MTTAIASATLPDSSYSRQHDQPHQPRLVSLGTAVPRICRSQVEVADMMSAIWKLEGAAHTRWRRIVTGTGIQTRHGVMPLKDVIRLSTSQRMAAYEQFAPALAAQAAQRALKDGAVPASQISDLIVVSCTGFAAPGLDVALIDELKLNPNVRRTMIGFMGCFGAITGLRAAVGACAANSDAIALVVCLELCSLHMRSECDVQNQVASALFADGAAAAVVASPRVKLHRQKPSAMVDSPSNSSSLADSRPSGIGGMTTGASLLLQQGRDWMTWRVTDRGFAMTLTRDVPVALREHLRQFVAGAGIHQPRSFVVHPGGSGILDAIDDSLNLNGGCGLQASRDVLRRYGNMSSATILFVLQELIRTHHALPAMLLAFGPGLTIESIELLPVQPLCH